VRSIAIACLCLHVCMSAYISEQEALLSQREHATCYVIRFCYVSRVIGVRIVPNDKIDLQYHSRALAVVPFDRPHTIFY